MDIIHGHLVREIPAGEFKQHCLALLDEVANTATPIVVTKRGKPVARVVPLDEPGASLRGSVRILVPGDEELFSTGVTWGAEQAD